MNNDFTKVTNLAIELRRIARNTHGESRKQALESASGLLLWMVDLLVEIDGKDLGTVGAIAQRVNEKLDPPDVILSKLIEVYGCDPMFRDLSAGIAVMRNRILLLESSLDNQH